MRRHALHDVIELLFDCILALSVKRSRFATESKRTQLCGLVLIPIDDFDDPGVHILWQEVGHEFRQVGSEFRRFQQDGVAACYSSCEWNDEEVEKVEGRYD